MRKVKQFPKRSLGIPRAQPTQQQIQIDPSDLKMKGCAACGHELFEQAIRIGAMSGLNPRNPTPGKELIANLPVIVCRACNHEYGKPVPVELSGN